MNQLDLMYLKSHLILKYLMLYLNLTDRLHLLYLRNHLTLNYLRF
jgi:hypothetical protein